MILSRRYPAGTPLPSTIHCPDEIVRTSRNGGIAIVETSRSSSIQKLRSLGYREMSQSPQTEPLEFQPEPEPQPQKGRRKKTEKEG